ncbi:VWA domain-containing protein [Halobacteriovorax sp. HLS]|uniref:VWA domain-containing protein n=1 Tax=Halobacteriovorax sp. HLS TaxID=2234000 RepID=UPI0019D46E11|nr:VWA domain-containing protein [Halobacteriovorax sp. HLS]
MVFSTSWIRKSICFIFILSAMTSCNEQEFYEKKFLDGAGVADKDIPTEIEIPTDNITNPADIIPTPPVVDNGGNNGGGTTTPTDPVVDNGGNNGGGTTTPTDPVVDNGGNNGGGTTTPTDPVVDNGGDNGGGTTTPTDPVVPVEPVGPVLKPVVENFKQEAAKEGKVDILWVVDDSGSMGDEQKALAYNFDVFIHEFLEKKIDFKMAVTTTDATSSKDGKWSCDPRLLDAAAAKTNEANFVKNFSNCIKVGTRGSGREKGLHTSKSFIERYDGQWMRDDAYLVVVYVSDEEDQSEKLVSEYVNFLKSKKNKTGLIKLYSIVTKESTKYRWETIGTRYLEASANTGGQTAHIKKDFYKILREMGGKIVNLLDSFALSQQPIDDKVNVKVNGSELASGYSYDSQSRSIKFLDGHIPTEGANIEISYSIVAQELN